VASIQFNETQASWVPADGTADAVNWTADHHQANHGNGSAMLPAIIEYMNKGVAHVIEKLIAAGIYDKTVVLVISEMGDGQDHSAGSGPITVASGMGLKSGQRAAGGNHYAVFADVFRMLGLTPDGRNVYNYGSGGIV
jgi:arylsulfatase A-like enzyme